MSELSFLSLAEVLALHELSLDRYGGTSGVRDAGGLEAAVEQPKNVFYYAQGDLFEIAAAYAFHLGQAQACLDGNKRTAVAAALMFLKLNGITTGFDQRAIYRLMIAIAERRAKRVELASYLREAASSSQT